VGILSEAYAYATFEDRNLQTRPAGFDADANTEEFIAQIPSYQAHGVNAFTLWPAEAVKVA